MFFEPFPSFRSWKIGIPRSANTAIILSLLKWKIELDYFYCNHGRQKILKSGGAHSKGHIISEWIYDIFVFPNYQQIYLMDFCPGRLFMLGILPTHLSELSHLEKNNNIKYLVYINLQGRNPSDFFVGNLEKSRLVKFIPTLSGL